MANLTIKQVASVMAAENISSAKASAKRRAGSIILTRATKLIKPSLPMMVRGYIDEPIGQVVLANIMAAAMLKYGSHNDKLALASQALMDSAMDNLVVGFDIEGKVNEILDGVDLSGYTTTDTEVEA